MTIQTIRTLTGLTLEQAAAILDEQLPPDAYSAVPGGADLTDIDPNYMRKTLNAVFGLCGLGWGYDYKAEDIETRVATRQSKNGAYEAIIAVLKRLRFWYKLTQDGNIIECEVPSSGASENTNAGYALSGAITNALGKAVSNIGFQESVYLGRRSHKFVKATPAPTQTSKPAKTTATLAPKPAAPSIEEIEEIDAEDAQANPETNPGDYVIPIGKRQGQKLGDQPLDIIRWYAEQMVADTQAKQALQAAARQYLKVKANGHPIAA